jgi:hypothetical protein
MDETVTHAMTGDDSKNARAVENEAARARMKGKLCMVGEEQEELRAATLGLGTPGRELRRRYTWRYLLVVLLCDSYTRLNNQIFILNTWYTYGQKHSEPNDSRHWEVINHRGRVPVGVQMVVCLRAGTPILCRPELVEECENVSGVSGQSRIKFGNRKVSDFHFLARLRLISLEYLVERLISYIIAQRRDSQSELHVPWCHPLW